MVVFAWLGGQMVVVFGAGPLLPRGLAAAGELSLLFLLTLGKPLLARVANGLGLLNAHPCWERDCLRLPCKM